MPFVGQIKEAIMPDKPKKRKSSVAFRVSPDEQESIQKVSRLLNISITDMFKPLVKTIVSFEKSLEADKD